jgi:hypothetical protein
MTAREVLEKVLRAMEEFEVKCKKFSGAITTALIREALLEEGFNVSERDVFIDGIPIEIDLLIAQKDASPINRIRYDPKDVLVVLEIKSRGTFGENACRRISTNFNIIKQTKNNICCIYITLSERKNYKWRATEKEINAPVYTLFWHSGPENKLEYDPTGNWEKLINDLGTLVNNG